MAEVLLSGEPLIAEIDGTPTERGTGAFWWMGQHSFALKLAGRVIYIDPYLEPNPARQTPPLFTPEQVSNADWVLCTHDHGDHIDPFALAGIVRASPNARFVAPRPHRQRMLDIGVPEARLRLIDANETLSEDGLRIHGIKARHEFFHQEPDGFPFLGYVVEAEALSLYHSGDTLIYDGLFTHLGRWNLDVAFLPINGRCAVRYRVGCLGNMTYQEAVDLAGDLEVGLTVPSHWDMFANNSEDPQKFLDYLAAKYPARKAWVGKAGERVLFSGVPKGT